MKSKGKYDKSDLLRAVYHLNGGMFFFPFFCPERQGTELAVFTIFTLFVIPSILMFFIKREKVRKTDT